MGARRRSSPNGRRDYAALLEQPVREPKANEATVPIRFALAILIALVIAVPASPAVAARVLRNSRSDVMSLRVDGNRCLHRLQLRPDEEWLAHGDPVNDHGLPVGDNFDSDRLLIGFVWAALIVVAEIDLDHCPVGAGR